LESLESRETPAALAALDPSFATAGKESITGAPFTGVALQSDGRIVAVGTSNTDFYVARFNPNGTPDTTFDGDGVKTIDFGGTDHANAVAIEPDGKIVIVGSTSKNNDVAIARLTITGALDATFNGTGQRTVDLGGTAESGNAVAILPGASSSGIIVAGTTGADFAVIHLNDNGTLLSGFGTGGIKTIDLGGAADTANALAIQGSSIVAAGTNGVDFALVRLNGSDGTLDTSFNTTGKVTIDMGGATSDVARGLAVQPNGSIVVVGSNGSDMAIARLTASGAIDTSFNTTGKQTVDISGADDARAVQLQRDGKILIIGDSGNNASDTTIVRLTTSGAPDTTFNSTGKLSFDATGPTFLDLGTAAVLSPQGRLVIAGQGGGGQVNGFLARVPVTLEDPQSLAVGGSLNGVATVYTPSGGQYSSPAATVSAFGSATVNVRATRGDVNGDGVEDTILVTGPGTPIRLAVVSGTDNTTVLVSPFDPFGGDFTGGGFVSAADFDNDGRSDVVVTPDQGGGPRVEVFSLLTDGTFTLRTNFFGIDDPNFRGGARTAAGDVNGDGFADLAIAAGFQGGPRVALLDGTTLLTASRTKLVNDFFAFDPSLRNGVFVTIGDVDGDGKGDLFFGAGPGGAPRLLGVSGQVLLTAGATSAIDSPLANFFVAGNASNRGGVRLSTQDIDGDGKVDVIAATGEGQASFVRVYFGRTFGTAGEPSGFEDLNPYASAVLSNGVFVG